MKKGFTIIELVIVISVLIILIGIAIPHMKGMQQSGNLVKAKGELQTLQAAMESYYSNSSPQAYIPSSTSPSTTYFTQVTPQIITAALMDPFAPTGTEYDAVTNGSWYAFGSIGPNSGASLSGFTISSTGWVSGLTTGNICVTNGTGC